MTTKLAPTLENSLAGCLDTGMSDVETGIENRDLDTRAVVHFVLYCALVDGIKSGHERIGIVAAAVCVSWSLDL